ncbi:peptidase A8 [Pontibacillus chungwhensis BH030062]|uniref:Lipoprotein signal peptidase n=2 Tax=Pontibacillus TaxID=289201 RepID=A0A0A2V1W7_9BACI|nr:MULTISPECIES: signal peptidase II [Pontibacillus]KGP92791.1 peptidase A8 [Pontibacillus chungwhensis BH030062]GGD18853.1 lipoprotein signal peptidase [Pontibacillus salipaludis]
MWYYVLAIVIILIDQLTKWIIDTQMKLLESIPVIEDVFYITSHRNKGAAWGMLEGQFWFFYIITTFVIVFVIYYIQKYTKDNPLLGISLGLILGGAVGNFIDRIFRKEVVDFLDVYIGSYDFPIFNVADSALVVGVGLVFIATILDERKKGSAK